MGVQREGVERADVLIVTAVKDEWDAVLAVDTGATPGSAWEKRAGGTGPEVCYRDFTTEGGVLRVAVVQAFGMGREQAVIAAAPLLERHPEISCLAMCGVCAGRRGNVALGDVIIADRTWPYDAGKLQATVDEQGHRNERFQGDVDLYRIHPPEWRQRAERFQPDPTAPWIKERPRSYEEQGDWVLERLAKHEDPVTQPSRPAKCLDWGPVLEQLWKAKWLEEGEVKLTEAGRQHIRRRMMLEPDELREPGPFKVVVGPIASGAPVVQDPSIFERLSDTAAMRKVVGLEMETSAILALAFLRKVPHAVVMKGVMDHADAVKSDNMKAFAARASAECLIAFLRENLSLQSKEQEKEPLLEDPALGTKTHEPLYENDEIRTLAGQLERARLRKRALEDASASAAEVDREILDLRRRLREGGQLRAGDALEHNRYLLLEWIGRGGFASVWAALDRVQDEPVAIKVLHPDQAREPSRRERFFRGARVMAGLEHPAVVLVLNPHGVDGGYHYFVMELIDGEDLHDAVVNGRLPNEEVVPLILRVGEALAEAHGKGIVHRDVKPGNILLDASRVPKLTDFDLVAANDTTGGTRTGALGTFLYAAPEQMKQAAKVDARADVYGLGMTTIFCLYGGELPETAFRHPEEVIAGLPCGEEVKWVLTQAIEVDPHQRFRDARSFCEALREATLKKAHDDLAAYSVQGDSARQYEKLKGLVIRLETERSARPATPHLMDLHAIVLRFEVSHTGKHVKLSLIHGDEVTSLGARVQHEPLLELAVARLQDKRAGVPPPDQGWRSIDEVLRKLQIPVEHLNVMLLRARRQMAQAGLPDTGKLVERRMAPRQIRLGTDMIDIVQL